MLAELLSPYVLKIGFFVLLILVGILCAYISKRYNLTWWGLLSVDGKKVSKGNLAFWVIFAVQVYYWVFEPQTVIAGLQEAFLMVLGYCLGTKFNVTAKRRLEEKSDNEREKIKLEATKRTTSTCSDKETVNLINDL